MMDLCNSELNEETGATASSRVTHAVGLAVAAAGNELVAALREAAEAAGRKLSNLFRFVEAVFGEGQELLILVTELTAGYYSARFISRHGCSEYFAHNRELLFYERQKEIIAELQDLDLGN